MKELARHLVRARVPTRRERGKEPRPQKVEQEPDHSVYKQLDSWEPPARVKDKTKTTEGRPRGRPRIPREKRRSVPFSFLMSPEEWEVFDGHIKELGCTASSFAREAVFKELGQELPPRPLAEGRVEKCRRSKKRKGTNVKK